MDRTKLRKRVFKDLLTWPWTVLPGLFGLGSLAVGAAMGSVSAAFYGFAGLLVAVGGLATRWLLRGDQITNRAFQSLQAQDLREKQYALDDLDRRLRKDDDPNTEQALRRLRALYETFKENPTWADTIDERSAVDIAGKVEHLFAACAQSLERSLELYNAAGRMSTQNGRVRMLEQRERLLQEVAASVEQFATTIDSVQALTLEKQSSSAELADLRNELDESLNVARRVEERMKDLESELGSDTLKE